MSGSSPPVPPDVDRVEGPKDPPPKNLGGRPHALTADEKTLATISGLGQIQCTKRECAAVLKVHEDTFHKFLEDNPEAKAAYEDGKGAGKMSLRRKQFQLAERNAAMAIFLGKNYLEQSDKLDHQLTGAEGGPVQVQRVELVAPDVGLIPPGTFDVETDEDE